jgi:hypothetical protein
MTPMRKVMFPHLVFGRRGARRQPDESLRLKSQVSFRYRPVRRDTPPNTCGDSSVKVSRTAKDTRW